MPNWVENTIHIEGKPEDIMALVEKARKPRPFGDKGEITDWENRGFSFWYFVTPPQEIIDSGEYFGTNGFTPEGKVGGGAGNWYQWNNAHWNTKWDACNSNLDLADDQRSCDIYFSTAWSIPEPVFEAMVEQHPDLAFTFRCVEEQGWGSEYEGEGGGLIETDSWDIPTSHADWVNIEGECRICMWGADEDFYYEDCDYSVEEEDEDEDLDQSTRED